MKIIFTLSISGQNNKFNLNISRKPCEVEGRLGICMFNQECNRKKGQVSILPAFYDQLFCTKVFWAAFLWLQLRFVIFCWKEIRKKAARKMLVKLTADIFLRLTYIFNSWYVNQTSFLVFNQICCIFIDLTSIN